MADAKPPNCSRAGWLPLRSVSHGHPLPRRAERLPMPLAERVRIVATAPLALPSLAVIPSIPSIPSAAGPNHRPSTPEEVE